MIVKLQAVEIAYRVSAGAYKPSSTALQARCVSVPADGQCVYGEDLIGRWSCKDIGEAMKLVRQKLAGKVQFIRFEIHPILEQYYDQSIRCFGVEKC
jgi:hypothetical protein